MSESLLKQVKALTHKANKFIEQTDIEQCQRVLVERQKLLEQLVEQSNTHSKTDTLPKQVIELFEWIQQQDQASIVHLQTLQQENTNEIRKQLQTKKGIAHYKNV